MIQDFIPIAIAGVGTLFFSALIYFAIRFFAYRRSFKLSHQFDVFWILGTLVSIFWACSYLPPLDSHITPRIQTWTAFATFLIYSYAVIIIFDQFLVEYFLVTVLKLYVSPPLRKAIILFVFLITVVVAIQRIFDINPWAVYAPTSLLSLGIGIALKDAFTMFFAGVSLSTIVHIGDKVRVGDHEGEVVDINWARTVLRNYEGDIIFIPNDEFQKNTFTNFNYRDRKHRCRLQIGASYKDPPQKVKKILADCARNVPGVLPEPEPEALLSNYGDSAINYTLSFWVENHSRWNEISSEISTRVWYAFNREGIEIPFPMRTVQVTRKSSADQAQSYEPGAMLGKVDLFKTIPQEEHPLLIDRMEKRTYVKGEVVVRQGNQGKSFYVVSKGKLEVLKETKGGKSVSVGELGPGAFFGELSLLTGEPRTATVRATTDAELLRLEKKDFQDILTRQPALADKLAEVVTARRRALSQVKDAPAAEPVLQEDNELSQRIRDFFNLSN